MNAIHYAVVALVFFGLADFIYKRAADAGSLPHHFLLSQAVFFSPSVIAIAYVTGALVWSPYALWGALGGFFIFTGLYNFSRSLIGGAVSINAPLFRLNFMITAALAIVFLNEALTPAKAAGLFAALLAVWLLAGSAIRRGALSTAKAKESLFRAALATLAFGAGNFCHKLALVHGVSPVMTLTAQVCVFGPLTFISVYAVERRISIPVKTLKNGVLAALSLLIAFIAFLRGIAIGEASVVTPIAQMGFIVTAVLGLTLLGEPLTSRKAVGLGAALVALAAFAISASFGS